MRTFLAFSCLVAVASARPDVSLGYNYPSPGANTHYSGNLAAPGGGSFGGGSFGSGGSSFGSGLSGSFGSGSSGSRFGGGSFGGGSFGGGSGGSFGGGSFGGGSGGGGSFGGGSFGGHGSFAGQNQHQAPIVSKHFHLYSAPEEQQDSTINKEITIGQAQKHYRVVFIKAPSENAASARISASYAPNEEKTVIYVLSKKPDEFSLENVATPAPSQPSKPEVHFIKYKTDEEAAHAQHQIQAQYDHLGGSSKVSDEGVAPVSSVIGALGGSDASGSGSGISGVGVGFGHGSGGFTSHGGGAGASGSNFGVSGPGSAYLPGHH